MAKKLKGADVIETLFTAASHYIAAVDAFNKFEKDNPNDSTKRWEAKLYARDNARETLREAVETSRGHVHDVRGIVISSKRILGELLKAGHKGGSALDYKAKGLLKLLRFW